MADHAAPFHIWEGVFDSFPAAATLAAGLGFKGETYRQRSLSAARECLEALKAGRPIPNFHKQRSTLLPPIVALMLGDRQRVRILDFGGGLGIGYMTLAESLANDLERVDYSIVEVAEVCAVGRQLFEGVSYLSALPAAGSYDLVHAASSLQYVERWQDLIERFAALDSRYILLSDVFAGAMDTFVTLQNYYESRIPHWFLNLEELLATCAKLGYRLAMKTYTTSRRLTTEDVLPMDNFPEELRLQQSLHLLLQQRQR